MTTGSREIARGEKGTKVAHQEIRCSSRGSMRRKPGGMMGETIPLALRSSGSKRPTTPRLERVIGAKQREGSNGSPTVDELLKTVKRLEKGFLSLADAVIAEIEGMKEDARSWQVSEVLLPVASTKWHSFNQMTDEEEREELWKTVVAFHTHQRSEMVPVCHRLESLEKRTSDIEERLLSCDPDTRVSVNDRLEELERRACELQEQAVLEKPVFKDEMVYRGNLLEQHRSKVEGSRRLGPSSRNSDSDEAILVVRKEI